MPEAGAHAQSRGDGVSRAAAVAALAGGLAGGVLLGAGFITAPAAFGQLPADPALAARIAGRVFAWSYGLATLAGLAAALACRWLPGRAPLRAAIVLAALGAFEGLVLTPLIAARGAELGIPFAWLHGASSALHVAAIVAAVLVVWRSVRGMPGTG